MSAGTFRMRREAAERAAAEKAMKAAAAEVEVAPGEAQETEEKPVAKPAVTGAKPRVATPSRPA